MKKYLKYISLIAFTFFSFYYTEKVTEIMNSKDPIMIEIKNIKNEKNYDCKEGYITSEGVVLGVNGKIIDVNESYSNMQGYKFDESLLVYKDIECKVNLETTKDSYIVKGNDSINAVSLFININDMSYMPDIIEENKNTKLNLIVTGKTLEKNEEYLYKLYKKGYEIIYGGYEEEDLKKYLEIMKDFNKNQKLYCISTNDKTNLKICKKEGLNTLKTKNNYTKDIMLNTKKNLNKGEFYIYKENKQTLEELKATINFIEGKKLKITNITDLLT